ncbi:glycosyltransferase family 9 protein [Pseudobacteriovorax antillogorgiicola]|uniref:Heptosyltransferase-2/heptosyltransferase-3 n=1 Tax=Pseudobacteriovorax antillogorgiicola TaxID=1513793 RepID=A0A1Y6BAV5_9BACT|nr:glycosyltransferase family 9 protein [Pseudobacteriovorax antillogorgiicola]TCS58864.1 heptosyltransferase-2/heptosyltransferase-3 [Pseudobacteriovorax antillogorgiicola]SME93915.1 heptosyltransferase-2/heptosyltransferase-3 [Pseudobacteriovorax antillogorgiicola]
MQRILIIQLRQLGDIILTTPCTRELKRAYPDAEIDFLVHKMGGLILPGNPYINRIISYSEKDSLGEQWQLIQTLRGKRYDLVLDFMYNPRSALLAFLSGAKRRLAFPSRRRVAYTELVPQDPESDYIVREKFAYLRYLGLSPQDESLILPWSEAHLGPYLENKGDLFPKLQAMRVILSPTHRREERQWPFAHWAELADWLVRHWQAQVIWIWGPGEKEFVEQVQGLCQEATQLAPKTSFRELAAFMANCDLFIGNSNGPSHVAVSCRIPSLQLHGPTLAKTWCPLNMQHRAVQKAEMKQISVAAVQQTLGEMKPVIEKRVEERQKFGDRMSWNFSTIS